MGKNQTRHRDGDHPVLSRMLGMAAARSVESERRRSGRVQSTGTAVVHGSFAAHARILDLAIGGVSLLVDGAAALPAAGAHVHLDVRLDGLGRWLHLSGTVVRADARGPGAVLVIVLLVVPPDFEDLVQDELLSALECARQPRILVVDGVRGRRRLVADAFRTTGCHVIEASSPLEAIAEIDQSRLHLRAVVIADTELASHADELRGFLGEMYPAVPLIELGQRDRTTGKNSLCVDRVSDLALQIFDLVGMPEQLGGTV